MLSARRVLEHDGVSIADIACRHRAGRGRDGAHEGHHTLVFVRRGYFVRSARGVETVLDPTFAYCVSPGEEERYDHPHAHGDDCTSLILDAGLVASLWGGDPTLPAGLLPSSPRMDLE